MAAMQYFLNNEQFLLKIQVPIKVTEYDGYLDHSACTRMQIA
jgi:hypothetical protein